MMSIVKKKSFRRYIGMIPLYRYKRQMKSVLMAVWMCVHEKFSPSIPIEMQRKADLIHSHLLFFNNKKTISKLYRFFFLFTFISVAHASIFKTLANMDSWCILGVYAFKLIIWCINIRIKMRARDWDDEKNTEGDSES